MDSKIDKEDRLELAGSSANLPRSPAGGFVSRYDREGRDLIIRLKEELSPERNQLIVLWGAGGVGKTTLAIEAARSLTEDFAQRIVWISADARADFTLSTLLDEVAAQLGRVDLRSLAPGSKEEQVRALIGTAPTLVVFDNVESIAPDQQLRCLNWIARDLPCPALITTRQLFGLARNIPIDSMSFAEARELLSRLVSDLGIPSPIVTSNYDRIIEAAEGNPLLLEWIVAQVDLAQDLNIVLDGLLLEGPAIERVFDRSFNLPQLGEEGRATLLAASLFVPSATPDALAEVAGLSNDPEVFAAAVKRLADLQLIEISDDERLYVERVLAYQLVKARLENDERANIFRQRFVTYFLRFAESNSRITPEDLNALESEKDNILCAADLAFKLKDWQSVMRVTQAIAFPGLLDIHGYWDEAIKRGEQAILAARETKSEAEISIARFEGHVATIRQNRGEYDEARVAHQQNLAAFRSLGSDENVASTLHQLGVIAQDQGDLDEARRLYSESLDVEKKRGDQRGVARALHQLAMLAQYQGDLDEAGRLYNESLAIAKKLGDQSGIAISVHQLARLAQERGETEEARQLYNESLEIAKRLGDQNGIATTLHQLARLAQDQDQIEEARRLYNESLDIKKRLGNQRGLAITLGQLGRLAEHEGNDIEAIRLFTEALDVFEKLKSAQAEITRQNLNRLKNKSSS